LGGESAGSQDGSEVSEGDESLLLLVAGVEGGEQAAERVDALLLLLGQRVGLGHLLLFGVLHSLLCDLSSEEAVLLTHLKIIGRWVMSCTSHD
jgi:hypothetical protein